MITEKITITKQFSFLDVIFSEGDSVLYEGSLSAGIISYGKKRKEGHVTKAIPSASGMLHPRQAFDDIKNLNYEK